MYVRGWLMKAEFDRNGTIEILLDQFFEQGGYLSQPLAPQVFVPRPRPYLQTNACKDSMA